VVGWLGEGEPFNKGGGGMEYICDYDGSLNDVDYKWFKKVDVDDWDEMTSNQIEGLTELFNKKIAALTKTKTKTKK